MRNLLVWGGWVVGLGAVVAMIAALRRVNRDRRDYVTNPSVTVRIREPHIQGALWQLRLEVTNVSEGHSYSLRATVINARGVGEQESDKAWPITWRHSKKRAHELSPGASELLLIGEADQGAFYAEVHHVEGNGATRGRADWPATGPITLEIMLVDPRRQIAFHDSLIIERPFRPDLPPGLRWAKNDPSRRAL